MKTLLLSLVLLGGSTQAPVDPEEFKQVSPTVIVWVWVPHLGPVPIVRAP